VRSLFGFEPHLHKFRTAPKDGGEKHEVLLRWEIYVLLRQENQISGNR
jgi:hypothetical protein